MADLISGLPCTVKNSPRLRDSPPWLQCTGISQGFFWIGNKEVVILNQCQGTDILWNTWVYIGKKVCHSLSRIVCAFVTKYISVLKKKKKQTKEDNLFPTIRQHFPSTCHINIHWGLWFLEDQLDESEKNVMGLIELGERSWKGMDKWWGPVPQSN